MKNFFKIISYIKKRIKNAYNFCVYFFIPDEIKETPRFIASLLKEFFLFVKNSPLSVFFILIIIGYYTHIYILDLDDNTSDAYINPNTCWRKILNIFLWWWFLHIVSYLFWVGLPVFYFLNSVIKAEEEEKNRPLNTECKELVVIPTFRENLCNTVKNVSINIIIFIFSVLILYVDGRHFILCE